jgi:Holliday junction resolvase RusA-like endonuclease
VGWPIKLIVPPPPSRNHSHVITSQRRLVPTKHTRAYQASVAALVRQEAGPLPPLPGLLVVEATYYVRNKQRRDTDNCHKVLGDTLATGLGIDDKHFLWRDIDIQVDREYPRIELTVYPKES